MSHPGQLRERIAFDRRADLSDDSPVGDGYGNVEGDWEQQFAVDARVWPKLGGEAVEAARLSGTQPMLITVRYSAATLAVTTAWRARNTRSGEIYDIRSKANVDERRKYIDILCEFKGEFVEEVVVVPVPSEFSLDFTNAANSGYLVLLEDI